MSVLVTGGTGKTGSRLAQKLREQGVEGCIAARNPPPGSEGRRFDWGNRDTWAAALEGVSAIYLVPPPGGSDTSAMIEFAGLAQNRGVRRFVLLSASLLPVGGPGVRPSPPLAQGERC